MAATDSVSEAVRQHIQKRTRRRTKDNAEPQGRQAATNHELCCNIQVHTQLEKRTDTAPEHDAVLQLYKQPAIMRHAHIPSLGIKMLPAEINNRKT